MGERGGHTGLGGRGGCGVPSAKNSIIRKWIYPIWVAIVAHRAARGPRSRAHKDQAFDPVRPDVSLHAAIRSQ